MKTNKPRPNHANNSLSLCVGIYRLFCRFSLQFRQLSLDNASCNYRQESTCESRLMIGHRYRHRYQWAERICEHTVTRARRAHHLWLALPLSKLNRLAEPLAMDNYRRYETATIASGTNSEMATSGFNKPIEQVEQTTWKWWIFNVRFNTRSI